MYFGKNNLSCLILFLISAIVCPLLSQVTSFPWARAVRDTSYGTDIVQAVVANDAGNVYFTRTFQYTLVS